MPSLPQKKKLLLLLSFVLISDIVENIGIKKVFTKLDLWWRYDNIQIKEGGEWKVTFMTTEESFCQT